MKRRIVQARRLLRLFEDVQGSTLTLTAVTLPAILGFSGLALDGAHWYQQRRDTQSMVDAAAIAGAYAKLDEETLSEIEEVVETEAGRNGFDAGGGNAVSVTDVSSSGSVGPGTRPLLEVEIERQVPLYFAGLFLDNERVTIAARAVSGVRNLGPQCVVALDQTASRAVEFAGNATADIGCGVASNSDSDEALYVGGDAILEANPAQAFGDIAIEGSGDLISDLPPLPFSPRVDDPFAGTSPARNTSCDVSAGGGGNGNGGGNGGGQGINIDASTNLSDTDGDGVITLCGDVTFQGSVDLPSANFVVRNGDVRTSGNTSVTGSEVSVTLTGDGPADVGRVRLNNNTQMDLSPPTSGPMEGMLFFQDPMANNPQRSVFNGGADLDLDGAIYMPSSHVEFSGGAGNPDNCLQIVSRTVTFTGNSFIRNNPSVCQQLGLSDLGTAQKQVVLVE